MIRISQIKLPLHHTEEELEQKIAKKLKIKREQIKTYEIVKKSIDARKKPKLMYVYSVDVWADQEEKLCKKVNDNNVMLTQKKDYVIPSAHTRLRPVIIGAGPAGLFCAYALVLSGCPPLVIERGRTVDRRTEDVDGFWRTGMLHPISNVQFGEGGAGTFSDGKLNTLVKDPIGRNRFVLETFVRFGAPKEILYENKPHIGTDILSGVIQNMRRFMEEAGAKFLFETCLTDLVIEHGRLTEIELNHSERMPAGLLVLAVGHSARDTFRLLAEKQELLMEPKAFAVGFRVEHPQEDINRAMYGNPYDAALPSAAYKVTANLMCGRGVYSFCMCPGGYVVNASSEPGRLCVNGMSYAARDGINANSAVIVSVGPEDFDGDDALSGVRFQERIEARAFCCADGKIPQQQFGDFCRNVPSTAYGAYPSQAKGAAALCNLRGILTGELEQAFIEGMHSFSRTIPCFDREDAILSGVESRTSSPLRIVRNDTFQSSVPGLYPCGEGAGYAGGIMSAAMDGLKVAEAILRR